MSVVEEVSAHEPPTPGVIYGIGLPAARGSVRLDRDRARRRHALLRTSASGRTASTVRGDRSMRSCSLLFSCFRAPFELRRRGARSAIATPRRRGRARTATTAALGAVLAFAQCARSRLDQRRLVQVLQYAPRTAPIQVTSPRSSYSPGIGALHDRAAPLRFAPAQLASHGAQPNSVRKSSRPASKTEF